MNTTTSRWDIIWEQSFIFRTLFYLVTPTESSPNSVENVRDVVAEIIPIFFTCICLEAMLCLFTKNRFRKRANFQSM